MTRFPVRGLTALAFGLFALAANAQVQLPPKPDSYHATIRYRISADRDGRVAQFREMQTNFKAAGFTPTEKEDANLDALDPDADRLEGTVTGSTATKLLNDPRV